MAEIDEGSTGKMTDALSGEVSPSSIKPEKRISGEDIEEILRLVEQERVTRARLKRELEEEQRRQGEPLANPNDLPDELRNLQEIDFSWHRDVPKANVDPVPKTSQLITREDNQLIQSEQLRCPAFRRRCAVQ